MNGYVWASSKLLPKRLQVYDHKRQYEILPDRSCKQKTGQTLKERVTIVRLMVDGSLAGHL